ncbi:type VII secretion protein EccB [Phytomonospora sp. NPDC050363]|uniref:type VII secretion protein EccB n=1 Tax=Phytomonospora sp. NPDC050363 TaxID=3155642 RepID=UPI0033E4DFFC
MRTRREQVQAQRFVIRRIVSAMLSANPESLDLPMRRMGLSILGGVMAGVLLAVGFWVVGILFPGGATSWQKDGTIVLEEETGASYVYSQGRLYPTLNFASARLFAGQPKPPIVSVHRKSLEGTPRDNPVGIEGAPDAVPDPKSLVGLPWQVCSAVDPQDSTKLATRVVIGAALDAAADLSGQAVPLLASGSYFLLWNDRLHEVPEPDRNLPAMSMARTDAVEVTPLLLNAIERGPRLEMAVGGAGGEARTLGGEPRVIGEVFKVEERYYVLDAAGLHVIGRLAAELLGWDENSGPRLPPEEVTANLSTEGVEPPDFPQSVPVAVAVDRDDIAVCGAYTGAVTPNGTAFSAQVHSPVSGTIDQPVPAPVPTDAVTKSAEYVWMDGGAAVLARSITASGNSGGPLYLIAGGRRFALAPEAVALLGYGETEPVAVFSSYLDLIPSGPALAPIGQAGP